ncbi:MAG TPA: inner membrane CreD family protein [Pyrinomonadaceae bacterium]|nr:inner membrane CreD family protein [Pyrinomonadaceae bacterium]
MTKRIMAIAFIFICTSVAWAILGGTIFSRTYSLDQIAQNRVASTWGAPQNQVLPGASYTELVPKNEESTENGKKIIKTTQQAVTTVLPLESSAIDVGIDLEHRQKGLLWYSTYKVGFKGIYEFRNTSGKEQLVDFTLPFPTTQAIYDDLTFMVDGISVPIVNQNKGVRGSVKIPAGKTAQLTTGYRSQGLNEWRYSFGSQDVTQVRDFTLKMKTNFKDIDFPDNTLSPLEKHESDNGWELTWSYKNLLSGYQIAMVMPEKLQPGPLAGRISFFAPVSLFFFFFLMIIITTMRGIELHPMNYFFLAAAFFSFHLLLAYLVDHVSIHVAFVVSAAVSVFLVVSYLRLVVGLHFASREAALAQFVYLVMFSYAFFLKGFTGLAITIGSVATLFVAMQVTGRIRWSDKFALKPVKEPAAELT